MKSLKKKRSRRERRVLVVALLVAALIATGSTFAWFTSQDEVTNRLSATANYNVSIAEDFQPPEDWIPGQEINKDVSAVNAGNVDAFVRMWLEGEMRVVKANAYADTTAIPTTISSGNTIVNELGLTATPADNKMNDLGYNYVDANGKYYKVLKQDAVAALDEVKSVQAGGYLVSAPSGAKWTYTTEQQGPLEMADGTTQVVAANTKVGTTGSTASTIVANAPCNIDSDTFVPETEGLYIFRRTIAMGATPAEDTYEYSAYYFDGTNYFAVCSTNAAAHSDYAYQSADPSTYKLCTASETVVNNSGLTWTYDATNKALVATYDGGGSNNTDPDDDIVINVALDNLGTSGQTWTRIAAAANSGDMDTFYFNDDVEAGATTPKLVDSVTLDKNVKQNAFLAFDFDLNVFLESVQVTMGENGNEMTTPVEGTTGAFAGTSGNAAPASAATQNAAEIADIAWSAPSNG